MVASSDSAAISPSNSPHQAGSLGTQRESVSTYWPPAVAWRRANPSQHKVFSRFIAEDRLFPRYSAAASGVTPLGWCAMKCIRLKTARAVIKHLPDPSPPRGIGLLPLREAGSLILAGSLPLPCALQRLDYEHHHGRQHFASLRTYCMERAGLGDVHARTRGWRRIYGHDLFEPFSARRDSAEGVMKVGPRRGHWPLVHGTTRGVKHPRRWPGQADPAHHGEGVDRVRPHPCRGIQPSRRGSTTPPEAPLRSQPSASLRGREEETVVPP